MNKIISIIISVVMLVMSSIIPGFVWPGTETVETGAFLEQVNEAFDYRQAFSIEPVLGVELDNEYYAAVATAAKYDVLVDYETIDVYASVTPEFVATVLVNAAGVPVDSTAVSIENASSIANVAKVSAAVENGIIALDARDMLSLGAMDAASVTAAIEKAVSLRGTFDSEAEESLVLAEGVKTVDDYAISGDDIVVAADSDLAVGDVFVVAQSDANITGSAYKVASVDVVDGEKVIGTSAVAVEEVFDEIDYAGSTDVNFATAMIADGNGEVLSDGYLNTNGISKEDIMKTLKKLANVSFSVKGFKIKAKLTDTGLNFSVSKSVCDGVTLSKSYELTNLSVDAKADMDLKKLNFNEVYLNFDYDLKDTTTISGSYAKTFGDEVESVGEKISGDSFWAKIGNKVLDSLDSSSIKLFTFTLPLGSTPLTVTFDVLLNIAANGRMEVIVVSEEMHGVEIINNKVSTVNDSEVVDRRVDIYGNFEVRLGLDVALGLYGYALVDVGVEGGVGAYVEATAKFVDADGNPVIKSTMTIPVDYLKEVAAGADVEGELEIGGSADIYGILNVSVGENSAIGKVGLSKTWTIFDRSNATFAHIDF